MRRLHVCHACNNEMSGVKTRIAVPHTCGTGGLLDDKEFQEWIDRCNLRKVNIPLHIKYKMYQNQTKQND